MTDQSVRYRRSPTVLWRTCPGRVLLLPLRAKSPLTLSGSGVDFWQLLAEPETLRSSAQKLAEYFDVDVDEVQRVLEPILDDLVHLRVVERVTA